MRLYAVVPTGPLPISVVARGYIDFLATTVSFAAGRSRTLIFPMLKTRLKLLTIFRPSYFFSGVFSSSGSGPNRVELTSASPDVTEACTIGFVYFHVVATSKVAVVDWF